MKGARIRQAAWVARCVGRGEYAPLGQKDITALAATLAVRTFRAGTVLFRHGEPAAGVWIAREGRIELTVGSGRRRVIVQMLRPGDVDGDIQLLLDKPSSYTARAATDVTCLFLPRDHFEQLLATRPAFARRWLSSVARRVSASQDRVLALLEGTLASQTAMLLAEETIDGRIELPQQTLAAMLGVQRPSLNRVLKDLERDGVIRIGYAAIDVLDQVGLADRATRADGRTGAT
jgi:CRP-like cAMP-binding protein